MIYIYRVARKNTTFDLTKWNLVPHSRDPKLENMFENQPATIKETIYNLRRVTCKL